MNKTYERHQDRIVGKWVVHAVIENTSPLLMSSGQDTYSDRDCIRWVNGDPYLPASSLIGVLRSWYQRFFPNEDHAYFWGSEDTAAKSTCQSHLIIDDGLLIKSSAEDRFQVRDGVRIDSEKGTAMDQGKYDYELLAPGHRFGFRMEVTARRSYIKNTQDKDRLELVIRWVLSILHHELFALGALTTTGFGKVRVDGLRMQRFDFTGAQNGANAWFTYLQSPSPEQFLTQTILPHQLPKIAYDFVRIDTYFTIKSALITGAYPVDEEAPDKVQLQTNGKFILSGKAIKGSLRHRAVRILKSIGQSEKEAEQAITHIFGTVEEESKSAIKSRLIVQETTLDRGVRAMVQDRIKIDRWTGGVMGGAKFDSQPIWNTSTEAKDQFMISLFLLNPKREEIALLLQLIKDLWTSDLAIGGEKNVGRGILEGHRCQIRHAPDQVATIIRKGSGITMEGEAYLRQINTADLRNLKTKEL